MIQTPPKAVGTTRRLLAALAAIIGVTSFAELAPAQEIQLTGPLAGAPAVRKQRLYRQGRFELSPTATFTLLDEYQRQIIAGLEVNYNFTDWFAAGLWGGFSPEGLQFPADLSDKVQEVNAQRQRQEPASPSGSGGPTGLNRRLTQVNLGQDFRNQLGSIDWVASPQLTFVPFRGKIAIFQSIYVDTDLFFFAGPAFVGVTERRFCEATTCTEGAAANSIDFTMESQMKIAPTFGMGFKFYANAWNAFAVSYRAMPFARNLGGFDNRGADPNGEFPDQAISDADQELKMNNMISIGWTFILPTDLPISE